MLNSLRMDIVFAARSFARTPGPALAVIVSIGLGIAANTVVFSMVNELMLRDMPVRDPDRLRIVIANEGASSFPEYQDFRSQSGALLEGLAAHMSIPIAANISASGSPRRVWGQLVSGNWFSLTGAPLYLGRGVLPYEDEVPGRDPVLVLGYGLWQQLGANPSIVGKRVVLSGLSYQVVGVAPPGFFGTDRGFVAEFWTPLAMRTHLVPDIARTESHRNCQWLEMTGRLRDGVSRQQATAALNVIYRRILAEHEKGRKAQLVVLHRVGQLLIFENELKLLLQALSAVVLLLLIIACANVANLLLARAASRRQEIEIRLALGASRGRIARQLLTESVLLASAGAVFGLLLSLPGTSALARLQPPLPIPMRFDFSPNLHVLAFTTLLAVLTGILFGIAPALAGSRGSLASGRFRRNRLSPMLVVAQVALSVVLLVGCCLFLRSLEKTASIDIGMKPEGVLMLAIDPMGQGYTSDKSHRFFHEFQRRIEAIRGVDSMSYVDLPPLSLAVNNGEFIDAASSSDKRIPGNSFSVGTHYFQATGISLLRGRDFDPLRDEKAPVMLINQAMALQIFGDENPVGRRIRQSDDDKDRRSYEVIGVVRNAKSETLVEGVKPVAFRYLSDFSRALPLFGITVMVRTHGNPLSIVRAVREQAAALDRDLPVFNVEPLTEHISEALLVPRLCGALFGTFAATGLVLAVVGLYGVLNYSVRTRTREIGIRLALGARPGAVAGMITRQGVVLVTVGLAVGMTAALALGRFISVFLYGVAPTDALTIAIVPVAMLAAGAVAVSLPARRAARIEPIEALRHE